MSDTKANENPDDFFEDEPREKRKGRSPIERAIVWILIVGLIGVVAIEFRSQKGHAASLTMVEEKLNADPKPSLEEIKKEMSGGPSFTETFMMQGSSAKYCVARWFSLFKEYHLLLVCSPTDEANLRTVQTEMSDGVREIVAKLDRGEKLPEVKPREYGGVAPNGQGSQPTTSGDFDRQMDGPGLDRGFGPGGGRPGGGPGGGRSGEGPGGGRSGEGPGGGRSGEGRSGRPRRPGEDGPGNDTPGNRPGDGRPSSDDSDTDSNSAETDDAKASGKANSADDQGDSSADKNNQ